MKHAHMQGKDYQWERTGQGKYSQVGLPSDRVPRDKQPDAKPT